MYTLFNWPNANDYMSLTNENLIKYWMDGTSALRSRKHVQALRFYFDSFKFEYTYKYDRMADSFSVHVEKHVRVFDR